MFFSPYSLWFFVSSFLKIMLPLWKFPVYSIPYMDVENSGKDLKQILNESFSFRNFAIFVAVLIFLCFPTVLTLQATFMHRDFSAFGYPLAAYNHDCFWRGEIPLWNPYNVCGIPYLAQWNTQFLYPPALFYMIFPPQWAVGIFCLFHLYLAGLGMYLLAKKWTSNNFAAAIAGLSYAFSGLVQYSLMWPNDVATLAWSPWLILSAEKALKEGGSALIIAIAIGSLQMLSGFPEGIIQTWFLIVVLAIFVWLPQQWETESVTSQHSLLTPDDDHHTVSHTSKFNAVKQFAFRLFIIIAGVTALCLIQLAPFYDLLIHSDRHADYGKSYWAMPWYGWANFILPLFYCFPASDAVFHQYDQQWTGSYYSGIIVFILALTAIIKIRSRLVATLSITLAFALVMALGDDGGLYKWIRSTVPILGFMRYPVKFVVLSTIIFPLLSAITIKHLFEGKYKDLIKTIIGVTLVVILFIGFLLFIEFKYPREYDEPTKVLSNGITRIGLLALCLFFIANVLTTNKQTRWIFWLILTLFWADLAFHSPKMNPVVHRSVYNPGDNLLLSKANPPKLGYARVMIDPYLNDFLGHYSIKTNTYISTSIRINSLNANCNLIDKIPKIDGMFPLYPKAIGNLVIRMYWSGKKHDIPDESLDFLSVAYTVSTNLIWNSRSNTLPFITAGQKPVFLDTEIFDWEGMLLNDFKYKILVYLPHNAFTNAIATNQTVASINIKEFSAHRIEFDIDAKDNCWVVINQTFYHHWKPFIDGVRTKIWEANSAFTALESPKGKHRIVLIYDDIYFKLSAFISILTFLLISFLYAKRDRIYRIK